MMTVHTLLALGDNYTYVVVEGDEALIVDPAEGRKVLTRVEELGFKPSMVLLTHHHVDHTAGCSELKAAGCEVVGPDDRRLPISDQAVRDGEVVEFAGNAIRVIGVPGHTRTHVAYYCANGCGMLWTGDAMFVGGCGRPFEGTPKEMWASLCKLRELPEETLVYCGHNYTVENMEFAHHVAPGNGPIMERLKEVRILDQGGLPTVPSTIGMERELNLFLQADDPFVAEALDMVDRSPVSVFAELRSRKDRW